VIVEAAAPMPALRPARPCIATEDSRHCVAALLHGAACCPDGECALCRATRNRMLRSGFPEFAVRAAIARTRRGALSCCPVCGFPPPPPAESPTPLPRLERPGRTASGSWDCRTCGRPLPIGKRHYCSHGCWREHVRRTEMDGDEIVTPTAPRAYRLRVE
jgi:hypothetical protein